MLGGFSNYLLYGICLAATAGGGIGLVSALSNRGNKSNNKELISQYILYSSDEGKECGNWREGDKDATSPIQYICTEWESEGWYQNVKDRKSPLLIRANLNKAKEAINKVGNYSSENYLNPPETGKSESWKIKNIYSCTSEFDETNNKKVIIDCINT